MTGADGTGITRSGTNGSDDWFSAACFARVFAERR